MRRTITTVTRQYETWLAKYTSLVKADLALKHVLMKRDAFSFLRATFYRWRQVWPDVCADVVTTPVLLAVGDLHIENFGTWRDGEGRLIWGINDFDEAYPSPTPTIWCDWPSAPHWRLIRSVWPSRPRRPMTPF